LIIYTETLKKYEGWILEVTNMHLTLSVFLQSCEKGKGFLLPSMVSAFHLNLY